MPQQSISGSSTFPPICFDPPSPVLKSDCQELTALILETMCKSSWSQIVYLNQCLYHKRVLSSYKMVRNEVSRSGPVNTTWKQLMENHLNTVGTISYVLSP